MSAKFVTFSLFVVGFAGQLIGGPLVARLSSTGPVEVGGVVVPLSRLSFFPVSENETVATQNASAVMRFQDGSQVTLQPKSQAHIERDRSGLNVRVLRGSAVYDLPARSTMRILNSRGEVISKIVDDTANAATVMARAVVGDTPVNGLVYKAVAGGNRGVVLPVNAISFGSFVPGSGPRQATGTPPTTGSRIVLPNGGLVQVTVTTNAAGQTTITVDKIFIPVTTTNAAGETVSTFLQVDSGPLVGATVNLDTSAADPQACGGLASCTGISFVPLGQSAPLAPDAAQQVLQQGVQTALDDAKTKGQVSTNTTAPAPTPVTTGQFSQSAP